MIRTFLTSKWTRLAAVMAAVMVTVSAMAIASAPAFAQSSNPAPNTPRQSSPSAARIAALEKAFANENAWLATQASNLQKIGQWVTRAQDLIDKAKAKGWDVGGLQAALNAFKAQIANAQGLHHTANAILTNHAGFNANGKVTGPGRAAAVQTVKDARRVMRQAVLDLRSVILNFRKEHKGSG